MPRSDHETEQTSIDMGGVVFFSKQTPIANLVAPEAFSLSVMIVASGVAPVLKDIPHPSTTVAII